MNARLKLHNWLVSRCSLFLICLFFTGVVHPHPHNWIALKSTFLLDDDSRLVSIKQRWTFDFYRSLIMHADLLNEFGSEARGLPTTAENMIKNLESYRYFSNLSVDNSPITLGVPASFELIKTENDGQLILVLEMTFDVKKNIKVENKTIAWRVFDPTYYIAMNHSTERDINIVGGDATECAIALEFPKPSAELIDYAQSLDRSQKDTDGLGASFAETAFITCF